MKNDVKQQIARIVVGGEYANARSNNASAMREFESVVGLLECERSEKDYDWQSNIFLPEFPSQVLTQSAIDAAQYFQDRDYVTAFLEDGSSNAKKLADAAKELTNRTLNQNHLNYYIKFMRARLINNLNGYVWARCWWEKETKPIVKYRKRRETLDNDVFGRPITDHTIQEPATRIVEDPEVQEEVVVDRFNFDILDPRNVFTDNRYVYDVQEKKWIIVRFERTLDELKMEAETMGYENLDQLEDVTPPNETVTAQESYNKEDEHIYHGNQNFDVIERHGKFWCIVKERDEDGVPLEIEPGFDDFGKVKKKAELIETIITFVVKDSSSYLIRFQPAPYVDHAGRPFKPFIRGLAYIHPTKDSGLGDGKFSKELQNAINDTFNISNDRVMLSTMPTLIGRRGAVEDNDTIYFEPQHVIEVETPGEDLHEFKFTDDVSGSLNQLGLLIGQMQQANSMYPTTMGRGPTDASTTATAIAGAESRTNTRTFYKSLTFEHTFLNPLYWMIMQMTAQFANPETGLKLAGKKIYDFDPSKSYTFKPVSQAIETEYSKENKRKEYITLLSYIIQTKNPKTAALANKIIARVIQLSGDEYEEFADALFDENAGLGESGVEQTGEQVGSQASNQYGVAMSPIEQTTRRNFYGL